LTPGWGGAHRLLQRVKKSVALEWLSTGRTIWPDEALRQGLVDEVLDTRSLDQRLDSLIHSWTDDFELSRSIKSVLNKPTGEASAFEKLWWSKNHLAKLSPFRNRSK
jgi:enoyl-CoA hydratase/carnithine racemase